MSPHAQFQVPPLSCKGRETGAESKGSHMVVFFFRLAYIHARGSRSSKLNSLVCTSPVFNLPFTTPGTAHAVCAVFIGQDRFQVRHGRIQGGREPRSYSPVALSSARVSAAASCSWFACSPGMCGAAAGCHASHPCRARVR